MSADSNCIDAGAQGADYSDENDIDGNPRVIYGIADIGADEWHNPADLNFDGVVNFADFVIFANYWCQTDMAESLDSDSDIDLIDLSIFGENWLWNISRSESDYNKDDIVNFFDFALLANNWKKGADTGDLALLCKDWLWELKWD